MSNPIRQVYVVSRAAEEINIHSPVRDSFKSHCLDSPIPGCLQTTRAHLRPLFCPLRSEAYLAELGLLCSTWEVAPSRGAHAMLAAHPFSADTHCSPAISIFTFFFFQVFFPYWKGNLIIARPVLCCFPSPGRSCS